MNTIKLDDPFSKYPVKPKPLTDKSDRSEGDGEEGGGRAWGEGSGAQASLLQLVRTLHLSDLI